MLTVTCDLWARLVLDTLLPLQVVTEMMILQVSDMYAAFAWAWHLSLYLGGAGSYCALPSMLDVAGMSFYQRISRRATRQM